MASKPILNFINGEFVAARSGKTFEDRSPADNRVIGMVSRGGEPEVDAAVKAAHAGKPQLRNVCVKLDAAPSSGPLERREANSAAGWDREPGK
jgi:hypothetical protein